MYADRIEEEARSVKARLGGGGSVQTAGDKVLSTVRGNITFKRTGIQTRSKGRSNSTEKWQHDLFEATETFLQPQGQGSGDLRALIASKQQAKLGPTRVAGRVAGSGLSSAKAAVVAASDLRQQIGGGKRRAGRPVARRKQAGTASAATTTTAQKRITVTLRNDEELGDEEQEDLRGDEGGGAPVARPAVVRGGRGSLLVTSRAEVDDSEEDGDGMDVDGGIMPGQTALTARRPARNGSKAPAGKETVASFLSSLGLSKYTPTFAAEEIDMAALLQMREEDLKELGIPMGPRKKILQAAEAL